MKKSGAWLIILAVVAVVATLFLAGQNGLIELIKLKQKEIRLEKKIVTLRAEIELTHQKVERLATDPDYLRKIAKERLEMVDPRDTIKTGQNLSDTTSKDTLKPPQKTPQTSPKGTD